MKLKTTFEKYQTNPFIHKEFNVNEKKILELREKLINDNLTISRFNDGEWIWMFKIRDYESKYNKRIGSDKIKAKKIEITTSKLFDIIKSKPGYYISVDSFSLKSDTIRPIINPHLKKLPNLIGSGVFTVWSMLTGFEDLFSIIENRNVIFVGPAQFKSFNIKIDKFIETHVSDAIFEPEKTIFEIENYLNENFKKNTIIIYSCGFVSKICIDFFYKKYQNQISQLDMGASICPFVGFPIRPWHFAMMKELRDLNLLRIK